MERFWSKVDVRSDEECWEWSGHRTSAGYGWFRGSGRSTQAHRTAWELTNGPIPSGLLVCHSCDNKGCVNPSHLFLGTHSDNANDMFSKGRHKTALGESASGSVLTEGLVREIREMHATGQYSYRSLGRRFSVDHKTIRAAVLKESWRHVQ